MKLIFNKEKKRFECLSTYEERLIPKDANFYWDGTSKRWWHTKSEFAIKLREYATPECEAWFNLILEEKKEKVEESHLNNSNITIPAPEGLEYLPFQKAGIEFILKRDNVLLADEMGLGKTIIALGYINLNPNLKHILIICPASLKLNWKREAEKWLVSKPSIDVVNSIETKLDTSNIVIINYDILKKFHKQLRTVEWDLLVCDECFPYNTKISTDYGIISIGEIVEKQLPVNILSYDLLHNVLCYQPISRYIYKPKNEILLEIVHQLGTLVCTPNHKIYVEGKGFVQAETINSGEMLYLLQENFQNQEKRKNYSKILQWTMCNEISLSRSNRTPKTKLSNAHSINSEKLRMVQKLFYCTSKWKRKSRTPILWNKLCSKMACNTNRRKDSSPTNVESKHKNYKSHKREKKPLGIRTNEKTQCQPRISGQIRSNSKIKKRKIFYRKKGRKWFSNYSPKNTMCCTRLSRKMDGIFNINQISKTSVRIQWRSPTLFSSYMLQSRFSLSKRKDRNRSRWKITSDKKMAISGQTQRNSLIRSGVVSIKIHKQRDNDKYQFSNRKDSYVYNLEIAKTHNYFANNILVSNCHKIKSWKALRTKEVIGGKGVPPLKAKKNLFLTGTPILNHPIEIWTIVHHLARNIFDSFWYFTRQYCNAKQTKYGMDLSGTNNLEELNEKLRSSIMLRRLKADVLPELPLKRRQIIELNTNEFSSLIKKEQEIWKRETGKIEKIRKDLERLQAEKTNELYKEQVKKLRNAKFAAFAEISRIRHETAVAKAPLVIEFIEDLFEEDENKKLVVFAHHHDVINLISERFKDCCVVLTGKTSIQNRQEAVDRFQNDPKVKLFIGSITAAGVGITLTASSHVLFAELDWVPANIMQCEDRCHRIGTVESVLIQHLVFDGSIDANIAKKLLMKQEMIEKALGDVKEDDIMEDII